MTAFNCVHSSLESLQVKCKMTYKYHLVMRKQKQTRFWNYVLKSPLKSLFGLKYCTRMFDGYSICNTSTTVQIQPTLKYLITIEICIFINSICSLDMVCHLQHCPFFVTSSHIFREQMISLQNEEGNVYVHVHVSKCTLSHKQSLYTLDLKF